MSLPSVHDTDNSSQMDLSIHECRLCRWHDIRDETVTHHTMLIDAPTDHGWIATDTLVEVRA